MQHFGWLVFCLTISAIFYIYQTQSPALYGERQMLIAENATYRLDLAQYHKNLKDCMVRLPNQIRTEIYQLHREELWKQQAIQKSQSGNTSKKPNSLKPE